MFRKIFLRLVLACVLLVVTVVGLICGAGYLALQQPAFYAKLRSDQYSESEQLATKVSFKQMEADFSGWVQRSIARQRAQVAGTGEPGNSILATLSHLQGKYDPTNDVHKVRITERQLNLQMAAVKGSDRGDWRHPRIKIGQDRVDFAVEAGTLDFSCVLSTELRPTLTPEGRLRLEFVGVRVGKLPLPMKTLLGWLPKEVNSANDDFELDLTGTTPCVNFKLALNDPEAPSIRYIKCTEGEIALEFRAPVLKQEADPRSRAPIALSKRK